MSRTRRPADPADLPPLYAVVQPGLEPVAADEITRDPLRACTREGLAMVVAG